MGSFIHYCEVCNAKLKVDDSYREKGLQCPVCDSKITFVNDDFPMPPPEAMPAKSDIPQPETRKSPPSGKINLTPLAAKSNVESGGLRQDGSHVTVSKSYGFIQDTASVAEDEPAAIDSESQIDLFEEDPADDSVYFWGRLGVKSVKIIAAIILLAGVFFTIWFAVEYSNNVRRIPELIKLEDLNVTFNEREKKLNSEFSNVVTLLKGEGLISSQGVLDGMVLPAEACVMPSPMPYSVMTFGELRTALRILQQYQQRTLLVKQAFIDNFGRLLQSVELPTAGETLGGKNKNEIVITTGGSKRNFYYAELLQRKQLENLLILLGQITAKQDEPERKDRVKSVDLRRFQAVAEFIGRRLFSQGDSTTIVRGSLDNTGKNKNNGNIKRDELASEVLQINKIIKDLSGDWQVEYEIAAMDSLLKEIARNLKIFELKRRQLRWILCKQLVELYLAVLGSAFALLVFGDFLRGHFDMADIMRRKRNNR